MRLLPAPLHVTAFQLGHVLVQRPALIEEPQRALRQGVVDQDNKEAHTDDAKDTHGVG